MLKLKHNNNGNTACRPDFPMGGTLRARTVAPEASVSASSVADRLVKAKSDGSISSAGTTTLSEALHQAAGESQSSASARLKSRSLEPLTTMSMWAEEMVFIDLVKNDRGLGFSILDYADPLNQGQTVIVIRSLVPGGVAQQDGRLIPGDRLHYGEKARVQSSTDKCQLIRH